MLYILYYFVGGVFGYVLGKFSKSVSFESMKSELSDPNVNLPPVGFGRPHIQILEVLEKNYPYETRRKEIYGILGKSKHHAYERQLWLWGMVDRRVENNPCGLGKIHFYTINSKGKTALVRFNNQF